MNNAFHIDDYIILISSTPIEEEQTQPIVLPLILIFLSIFLSIFLICFLSISLFKKLKKWERTFDELRPVEPKVSVTAAFHQTHDARKPHSLFLEIINSDSSDKLNSLLASVSDSWEVGNGGVIDGLEEEVVVGKDLVGEDCRKKKKKKKKSKKKGSNANCDEMNIGSDVLAAKHQHCLDCLYPFTSSSSATQRKIKHQYDQLMKSNASKGLTMNQVGEFVNCLVEARKDLQHKSEMIQRKFTITKALLMKADRSSFDRLSQQLYKLEAEQKRLEEDANVYNRLQQQLKLSPAYKKMLDIGARMEKKAALGQLLENKDTDFPDISFEELLAQEKKDTFWQRNGKLKSCRANSLVP